MGSWLCLVALQVCPGRHKVRKKDLRERSARKQKTEQFLEPALGWEWFRFPPVGVERAVIYVHGALPGVLRKMLP